MYVDATAYLRGFRKSLGDPLYTNFLILLATRILIIVVGFAFWLIAARLYPVEAVGVAVALLTSGKVINYFATLGLENSIIRFSALLDHGKVVSTSIIIVFVSALIFGTGYGAFIVLFSPGSMMDDVATGLALFVMYGILSSLCVLTGNTSLASRKPVEFFIQNVFISSRVLLLLPLVFLGSTGIVGAAVIACAFALLYVFFNPGKRLKFSLIIDREYVAKSFRYTSGNYMATLLSQVPLLVLPMMVLQVLGEADAAIFYVAFAIGATLHEISNSVCTSLFVEGSHGRDMRVSVMKSLFAIYSLQVPGVAVLVIFGNYILQLYGSGYSGGLDLLRLIAINSLLLSLYTVFCSIQKVNMGMDRLIRINILFAVIFLPAAYFLMKLMGILGVGYAMIITFLLIDLVILAIARKEKWI
jgi:O-antigen/teichoic acid export membrane protein